MAPSIPRAWLRCAAVAGPRARGGADFKPNALL